MKKWSVVPSTRHSLLYMHFIFNFSYLKCFSLNILPVSYSALTLLSTFNLSAVKILSLPNSCMNNTCYSIIFFTAFKTPKVVNCTRFQTINSVLKTDCEAVGYLCNVDIMKWQNILIRWKDIINDSLWACMVFTLISHLVQSHCQCPTSSSLW